MNKPHKSFSVDECNVQASILLKSLHSNDAVITHKTAKRFQRLPELENLSFNEMIQAGIKRKHALAVIANEKGFKVFF